MPDLKLRARLTNHIGDLPVLPQALVRLMSLNLDDDDSFDQLLDIVRSEPNFTVRVLTMANSAVGGSRVPVTTLRNALSRIGSEGAKNLIMALGVTRVFVPRDQWEKSLWKHALGVAVAARELALLSKDPEVDPGEAYVCGLLHDIGRFVLFQEGPEALSSIDEADWDTPETLVAMEKSICGLTHAELGAFACRRWQMPELIQFVVRNHHNQLPEELVGAQAKTLGIVQAADFAMFFSARPGSKPIAEGGDRELQQHAHRHLPKFIDVSLTELRALLLKVTEESGRMTAALGLG